jgi:hypothetical protein
MQANWYILYVRKVDANGKPMPLPAFPLVGDKVVHTLGKSDDGEQQKADKNNPLWTKIQDGVRPAWAPDILRMGYAVVFSREGFPKMAIKLGLRNPAKLKQEKGGISHVTPDGKRILNFDDVWVVGAEPERRPFPMPPLHLTDEEWWLSTSEKPDLTSAFMAPGGVKVMLGAQRLADVVAEMLRTPHGRPRPLPYEDDPDDYSEFVNPLEPVFPWSPDVDERTVDTVDRGDGQGRYAGLELFRY